MFLYGSVNEGFIYCDILCESFDFAKVVNYNPSNSKSCYVGLSFLWFDVTDYYSICPFPILWDL